MKGNVGFVFTNEDLKEVRDMLESFKVSVVDTQFCGACCYSRLDP